MVVLPLVRANRYVLSCSIATANRCAATALHRKLSMLRLEKRCGEQLSVRPLPFKTECFIPAAASAVSPLRLKTARARQALLARSHSEVLYRVSSSQVGFVVNNGMSLL